MDIGCVKTVQEYQRKSVKRVCVAWDDMATALQYEGHLNNLSWTLCFPALVEVDIIICDEEDPDCDDSISQQEIITERLKQCVDRLGSTFKFEVRGSSKSRYEVMNEE